MINRKILRDEVMMLPIEYNEKECEEGIDNRLKAFENKLKDYDVNPDLLKRVNEFCDNLKKMYEEYYLGHQNKAYKAFKDALTMQTKEIGFFTSTLPGKSLYRARRNSGNLDYKNDEMFHIRYSERGKVQTQRFSFPGLPCLYLGGSSYVCWLELNRPQFEQFQVATIRQKNDTNNFKVIDLCIHPLEFYKRLDQYDEKAEEKEILRYLQWWPIMAACSIVVKNEEDSFKPEYIFPQYMLQYILEEKEGCDYIGIKYISTKVGKVSKKQYESDGRTYTNYVFPIRSKEENESGFCKILSERFTVIRNYSGKELQILTDMVREPMIIEDFGDEDRTDSKDDIELFGTNDIPYLYSKSIFGRIETILENKDLDKYKNGKMIIKPISGEEIERLFEE